MMCTGADKGNALASSIAGPGPASGPAAASYLLQTLGFIPGLHMAVRPVSHPTEKQAGFIPRNFVLAMYIRTYTHARTHTHTQVHVHLVRTASAVRGVK